MEIIIINGILAAIMTGIFCTWIYFIGYMIKSLKQSPMLEPINKPIISKIPKVSVILPARNEEKYIAKCLDSLLNQDYENFEIIVINDSSTDRTIDIMYQYAMQGPLVIVNSKSKPDGWVGKNWACYQGYLKATGDVFLFTDADTVHSPSSMSLAVANLIELDLDALTAIPKLLCRDIWSKITLPVLSNFLHSRFSALRVNDPKTKTGYFFGSFFIITRSAYEAIGTHKIVRHELVEDGALGNRVKEGKFRMKMVRGERHIDAIWARDFKTLWDGLRRLMVSIYSQDRNRATLMAVAIFFLLLEPFLLFPYSLLMYRAINDSVTQILMDMNFVTIFAIFLTNAIQSKFGMFQNPLYAVASPLGGALISLCFISSIIDAKKRGAVSWRDRQYTIDGSQHPFN